MITEIEIEVECEGAVTRGKPAKFDVWFGNWVPAEPSECDGFKVFCTRTGIELTDVLPENAIEKLKQEFIDLKLDEMDEAG